MINRVEFEIYFLKEYCGYSLKELEIRYYKKTKTISELLRVFKLQLAKDQKLAIIIDEIVKPVILGPDP